MIRKLFTNALQAISPICLFFDNLKMLRLILAALVADVGHERPDYPPQEFSKVVMTPYLEGFVREFNLRISVAQSGVFVYSKNVIDLEDYGQHLKCLAWCIYQSLGIGSTTVKTPQQRVDIASQGASISLRIEIFKL